MIPQKKKMIFRTIDIHVLDNLIIIYTIPHNFKGNVAIPKIYFRIIKDFLQIAIDIRENHYIVYFIFKLLFSF